MPLFPFICNRILPQAVASIVIFPEGPPPVTAFFRTTGLNRLGQGVEALATYAPRYPAVDISGYCLAMVGSELANFFGGWLWRCGRGPESYVRGQDEL